MTPNVKISANSNKVACSGQWHLYVSTGAEIKQCEVSVRLTRQTDFRGNWRGWLRHCIRRRKFGSDSDGAQGIFN
jgi:hypothetical protein